MKLDGHAVLITGAKGGLGSAVTEAFLRAGARVAGVSRSIADTDFPHPCFAAFPAELANAEAAREVVSAVISRFGAVDALVHLVGGFAGGQTIDATSDATLDRMLDVNFRSAFHIVGAVLPPMRERGSGAILAIGSRAAVEPQPLLGAYAASKAALAVLIRTVALENKDRGISANLVMPGTLDTAANRAAMPTADPARWVAPWQVAELLVHLASPLGSQVSGALLPVYGGEL